MARPRSRLCGCWQQSASVKGLQNNVELGWPSKRITRTIWTRQESLKEGKRVVLRVLCDVRIAFVISNEDGVQTLISPLITGQLAWAARISVFEGQGPVTCGGARVDVVQKLKGIVARSVVAPLRPVATEKVKFQAARSVLFESDPLAVDCVPETTAKFKTPSA